MLITDLQEIYVLQKVRRDPHCFQLKLERRIRKKFRSTKSLPALQNLHGYSDAVWTEVLTAVSTKMAVCWVVAPCSLGDDRPDDGGSTDLRNVGKLIPVCTVIKPRRQPSSHSDAGLRVTRWLKPPSSPKIIIKYKHHERDEISGFYGGKYGDDCLLGCCGVWHGRSSLTFWGGLLQQALLKRRCNKPDDSHHHEIRLRWNFWRNSLEQKWACGPKTGFRPAVVSVLTPSHNLRAIGRT
jgi:hypothetical protein